MTRYFARKVTVSAYRYRGGYEEVLPPWLKRSNSILNDARHGRLFVNTPTGQLHAKPGDWIVRLRHRLMTVVTDRSFRMLYTVKRIPQP